MFHKQLDSEVFPPLDNAPVFWKYFGYFPVENEQQKPAPAKNLHTSAKIKFKISRTKFPAQFWDALSNAFSVCKLLCSPKLPPKSNTLINPGTCVRSPVADGAMTWHPEVAGCFPAAFCIYLHLKSPTLGVVLPSYWFHGSLFGERLFCKSYLIVTCVVLTLPALTRNPSAFFKTSAVVGMTTVPTQFTIMKYPRLDMHSTCLQW